MDSNSAANNLQGKAELLFTSIVASSGMEVNRIVTAALSSSAKQAWVNVADY